VTESRRESSIDLVVVSVRTMVASKEGSMLGDRTLFAAAGLLAASIGMGCSGGDNAGPGDAAITPGNGGGPGAGAGNDAASDAATGATSDGAMADGGGTGAVPSNDGGAVPALTGGQVYCVVSYSSASADFNGPEDTWSSDVVSNFGAPSVAQAGAGHDTISIVANSFAGGFARDGKQRVFYVSAGAGVGTVGTPVSGGCTNVYYAPTSGAPTLYTWIADKTAGPTSSCTVTLTGVQGAVYTYDVVANLVPDSAAGVVPGVGTATAHATCTADLP
jgi:hypothetical protein